MSYHADTWFDSGSRARTARAEAVHEPTESEGTQ